MKRIAGITLLKMGVPEHEAKLHGFFFPGGHGEPLRVFEQEFNRIRTVSERELM